MDAIRWLKLSWDEVDENTIRNCFQKCEDVTSDPGDIQMEVDSVDSDEDVEEAKAVTGHEYQQICNAQLILNSVKRSFGKGRKPKNKSAITMII